MTSEKTSGSSDINALAAEVMDLWQEHLAIYAADPTAKAELMRLLEPQRRVFADWAAMMQNAPHAPGAFANQPADISGTTSKDGAASATPSFNDGALRLAQLAHRVAELEKRLEKLESSGRAQTTKTSRRTKFSQH